MGAQEGRGSVQLSTHAPSLVSEGPCGQTAPDWQGERTRDLVWGGAGSGPGPHRWEVDLLNFGFAPPQRCNFEVTS